jgi:hypothetical protein
MGKGNLGLRHIHATRLLGVVSNDNEIGSGQMLHHAHFYMKGGLRTFAASATLAVLP